MQSQLTIAWQLVMTLSRTLLESRSLCSNLHMIVLNSKVFFVHQDTISTGNSYKCELSGLFAIVYLSHILCTTYDITQDSILVVCDTQTALKKFSHGSSWIQMMILLIFFLAYDTHWYYPPCLGPHNMFMAIEISQGNLSLILNKWMMNGFPCYCVQNYMCQHTIWTFPQKFYITQWALEYMAQ